LLVPPDHFVCLPGFRLILPQAQRHANRYQLLQIFEFIFSRSSSALQAAALLQLALLLVG
jgi:hypothetical protein